MRNAVGNICIGHIECTAPHFKMKPYADRIVFAQRQSNHPDDTVLVKLHEDNELEVNFNPTPLRVITTKGSMVGAEQPDGSLITQKS